MVDILAKCTWGSKTNILAWWNTLRSNTASRLDSLRVDFPSCFMTPKGTFIIYSLNISYIYIYIFHDLYHHYIPIKLGGSQDIPMISLYHTGFSPWVGLHHGFGLASAAPLHGLTSRTARGQVLPGWCIKIMGSHMMVNVSETTYK